MQQFIVVLLIWVAAVVVIAITLKRTTVFEHEKGLMYTKGRFVRVVDPGSHWYSRLNTRIERVDMRARFTSIGGQEVLSADSVSIKMSLAAKFEVVDPFVARNSVENYEQALYLELQLALREIVGSRKIDEVLEQRQEIGAKLLKTTEDKIADFGVKLLSVSIKDIMFPGELKKIFAQAVKAQKEGIAQLERARGETAALRSLANAARMIEHNPALLQLRVLQAVGENSGNTFVLGVPGQPIPLPVRPRADDSGEAALPSNRDASQDSDD
jgi:regulator of protease activity HflC (stomatin/prohibitin superfamily)